MPANHSHPILRRVRSPRAIFAGAMLGAQGLNGISTLLILRWVGPLAMGYWGTAQLLQLPLDALKMGVLSGMSREYPYLVGRGEDARALEVVQTGLAHSLMMTLAGLAVAAVLVAFNADSNSMLTAALIVMALAWALGYYAQFVRSSFRSSSSFVRLGGIELGIAITGVVTLAIVWRMGFDGMLARTLLLAIVAAVAFHLLRPVRVRPRFHRWAFREMFRFGRHTYATGYLLLVGQQAERILLLGTPDGVRLIGLYAPVFASASLLQVVPGAIHGSSYPAFVEAYGRDGDARALLRSLLRQMRRTALLMLLFSAATAAALATLIHFALPKYEESLVPAVIACAAGPFYAARMLATYYSALRRWPEYYAYTAAQTALPYAFIALCMLWLAPLEAAATGFVAAVAVSSCIVLLLTMRHAARTPIGHTPAVQTSAASLPPAELPDSEPDA